MNEELKRTTVCYGEEVLMMRIDDCIVFGNKSALLKYVQNRIEKTDEWIPVSERVPEEDVDVLLQFPNSMAVGYIEDDWWSICTYDDMYSGLDEGDVKPIAWMPLPEPYRGDR